MKLGVSTARNRLMGTTRRIRDPRRVLDAYRLRLDEAERTAVNRVRLENERRRTRLQGYIGALSSLSPLAVLERGYSVVTRPDGRTVRESTQVSIGDSIQVRLPRGRLDGTVDRVHSGKK
jgi:exodeoxyribonuclease VII large subunit